MSEYRININTGDVIIGDAAFEEAVQSCLPGDIVPVKDLLALEDFPFEIGDFDSTEVDRVVPSRETLIEYGFLALRLCGCIDDQRELKRADLEKLRVLGFIPPYARFVKEFGGIIPFREVIDSPGIIDRYQHTHISKAEIVEHARNLCGGGRVTLKDIDDSYSRGEGPNRKYIYTRVGGINKLNEYLGYPSKIQTDGELIELGVRVVLANSPDFLTSDVFEYLAGKGKSQWPQSYMHRFGSWTNFKSLVLEKYNEIERARQNKAQAYRVEISKGELPVAFAALDQDELITVAARYKLAKLCAPGMDGEQLIAASGSDNNRFLTALNDYNQYMTVEIIEDLAEDLGIFDDIWKLDQFMEYLHISEQDIEIIRAKKREARIRQKANNTSRSHETDTRVDDEPYNGLDPPRPGVVQRPFDDGRVKYPERYL